MTWVACRLGWPENWQANPPTLPFTKRGKSSVAYVESKEWSEIRRETSIPSGRCDGRKISKIYSDKIVDFTAATKTRRARKIFISGPVLVWMQNLLKYRL